MSYGLPLRHHQLVKAKHYVLPEGDEWQPVAALNHVVGQSFGWSCVGTNYRGYADSFTLALGDPVPDALQPRLMFLGEASSLSCFDVTRSGLTLMSVMGRRAKGY